MATAARATACANVALVKYWGKRDAALNLPATGSISVSLQGLVTRTHLVFDEALAADELSIDGAPASAERVARVLDVMRARAGTTLRARIDSRNDFPTSAGLASSASGLAALVLAADRALGLGLDARELSRLARLGSGSAARSVPGGFVELHAGRRADGEDCFAEALAAPDDWPLAIVVAITTSRPKATGSTAGMERTRGSSPFFAGWVESAPADLDAMRLAIARRDLSALGELAEQSALKMHGLMLSAGLVYWNGATVELVHAVRALRQRGVEAYFTIDAGPQVKVICSASAQELVRDAVLGVGGVERVIVTAPGPSAHAESA